MGPEIYQIQFSPAGLPSFCLLTCLCRCTAVILEKVFMTLQSEHEFTKGAEQRCLWAAAN